MSATLIRYENQTVTPKHDSMQWDDGRNGIIEGCNITHLGANVIRIEAGYISILGRLVEVTQTDINCQVSPSGELNGQLFLRMDLSSDNSVEFISEAAAVLTPLTQEEDANFTNGIYELALATYNVSETTVSNLEVVVEKNEKIGKVVNELNENLNELDIKKGESVVLSQGAKSAGWKMNYTAPTAGIITLRGYGNANSRAYCSGTYRMDFICQAAIFETKSYFVGKDETVVIGVDDAWTALTVTYSQLILTSHS